MKRVILESPYAGNIEFNLRYLRACMHDSLLRGEAPFCSHGLYTQPGVLRDDVPEEREAGIHAGFAWRSMAELTVVYDDLGISRGMQYGIDHALKSGVPVEYRQLGRPWTATNALGVHISQCNERQWSTGVWEKVSDFCTSWWGRS